MPAYVISEVSTRDPELMERYRDLAAQSIEQHGGRYLDAVERRLLFVDGA